MSIESKLLQKLKEQESAIKEKIKKAKKAESKKQAAIHQKKCAIIGIAILAEMEENQGLKSTLNPIIEKRVTTTGERKIIGLEPLPKANKENSTDIANLNAINK